MSDGAQAAWDWVVRARLWMAEGRRSALGGYCCAGGADRAHADGVCPVHATGPLLRMADVIAAHGLAPVTDYLLSGTRMQHAQHLAERRAALDGGG